ncbi:hypothetical protein L6452_06429 [Arctium lappa]|uniref:Uncharacterized protein n=1 Tax=Arctium lappa TaxID=4217 RepID=A0ACB9EJ37_ARCLA|nr:hypothetical protein L6452_06429 [Arctium lappa]
MALSFLFSLILLSQTVPLISSSSPPSLLKPGSSLSVENKHDLLISPNGLFTAGFYSVGENAYCFSVWYTKLLSDGSHTIVWMANRDVPVNGKRSKLSLLKTGNLVLRDADQPLPIWTTTVRDSTESAQLKMNNSGNLYLQSQLDGQIIWQSFASPTNTLLPYQLLTKDTLLVSSRSSTNHSSGFYKLFFDNDNVIRLVYDGPQVTGVYWPSPELRAWESGRSTYGHRRIASMDFSGHFISSDGLFFNTSDVGDQPVRRLTVDTDGNFRAYSLDELRGVWRVTWQAISETCRLHGSCGENATCLYDPGIGRRCSCLPNYKMINHTDWSYGCEPEFKPTLCGNGEDNFLQLPHFDFYGYDAKYLPNTTLNACKQECANICNCKGFQFKYDRTQGFFLCYPKFKLLNGIISVNINGSMYLKLPKSISISSKNNKVVEGFSLTCSGKPTIQLDRAYDKNPKEESLKYLMLFTYVFGAFEIICIIYFFYRTRNPSMTTHGYLQAATGFKRFSYAELKKASNNFSNEIGRGGGGIVYKGALSDNRVAAIKHLKEFSNNEGAELLAEISTLGRLNHMNLIEMWGYCAERKHSLLVYEYMENGSLAQNLHSKKLDWGKRFDIAVGTAKGLSYLHEECLEWVLHCDVKPHNILLDSNYKPKVADFGLSKLLDRDGIRNSQFTRARGTRGYMAPEWLFVNLPITSKVDVFSYGVVMLEMITGRSPTDNANQSGGSVRRLDSWVTAVMAAADGKNDWIEEIIDSTIDGKYDKNRMEILVTVALLCCNEDKDARPTMSQVVDMLLHVEEDNSE